MPGNYICKAYFYTWIHGKHYDNSITVISGYDYHLNSFIYAINRMRDERTAFPVLADPKDKLLYDLHSLLHVMVGEDPCITFLPNLS